MIRNTGVIIFVFKCIQKMYPERFLSFIKKSKGFCKLLVRKSAGGENRTRTGLTPPDFESGASTNSTTPA